MLHARAARSMAITDISEKLGDADGQERPLVLIVDDSAFNRELLPNILHSEAETKPGCLVFARGYGGSAGQPARKI